MVKNPYFRSGPVIFWPSYLFKMLTCLTAFLVLALSAKSITLVSGGTTSYVIATKTGCDSNESSAATDFQSYIFQMSGVTIPINSYASLAACPANSVVIGSLITSPTLSSDETQMQVVSNQKLYLRGGGNTQATRYAVFYFLEKQLGVRYYTPTYEYVPTLSTITVPNNLNDLHVPSFDYRYIFAQDLYYNSLWCMKNRVNNGAVQIDGSEGNITANIVTWAQYGTTHPEYFPLHGTTRNDWGCGWLCWTNPDLPQIIADYIEGRMAVTSSDTIIEVAQGDVTDVCQCTPCQTAITNEGGAGCGPMIQCLNAAAAIVAQTYPNRKILTMAYMNTVYPPVTHPASNLIIQIAHWNFCDLHAVNSCTANSGFQDILNAWQAITPAGNMHVWHYLTNFQSQATVWPNVNSLIPDLKNYYNSGVRGFFDEGVYWGRGMDLGWLKYYLLSKALWDVNVDATTTYNDFLIGVYGNASTSMNNYIQLLESQVANWHANAIFGISTQTIQDNVLPPSVFSQADAYFDTAESTALAQGQAWYDRVRFDRYSLLYMHSWGGAQLGRVTTPLDVFCQYSDYNHYLWGEEFKNIVGSRGCGGEFACDAAARSYWQRAQGGQVFVAENNKIKIAVCPGVQGQTISLIDKTSGKELLHGALLNQDPTGSTYPFSGGIQSYEYTAGQAFASPMGQVQVSGSKTIDGSGNQIITSVTANGIGSWSPQTTQFQNTRVVTLAPNNATSFTVTENMLNNGSQQGDYSPAKINECLWLGGDCYYQITAHLAGGGTQVISTFPTSNLNVTSVDYDNLEYGVRLTQSFGGATFVATFGQNDQLSKNTITSQCMSPGYNLQYLQNPQVLNATYTLTPITAQPLPGPDVTWTNFVNTAADQAFGSFLYKNAGANGYNANATSEETIPGDGWVECSIPAAGGSQQIGLCTANPGPGMTIPYAILEKGNGTVQAWESTANVGSPVSFVPSDRLRVQRIGSTVYYKKNGDVFYTSTVPSTGTLLVDGSLPYVEGLNGGTWGLKQCRVYSSAYTAPTPTITAPANNAVIIGNSTNITATVSHTGGSIKKVEFFQGTTKLGEDTSSPYSYSWTSISGGSYFLTAKACDDTNDNAVSSTIYINVWNSSDIGSVGAAGSASYSSGTFTVAGAGAGITGSADAFRSVYKSVSGDFTMVARVATFTSTQTNARAGIMARASTAAGAIEASTLFKPKSTIQEIFTRRTATNGTTTTTAVTGAAAPQWVKLVRTGNSFTSFKSVNGTSWTAVGTAQTVTMTDPILVGLAVTSGTTASATTATFDNFTIDQGIPPLVNLDADTLSLADGAAVNTWGIATKTLGQPTFSAAGMNGHKAINFPGNSQMTTSNVTYGVRTIFIVYKETAPPATCYGMLYQTNAGGITSNPGDYIETGIYNFGAFRNNSGPMLYSYYDGSLPTATPTILTVQFDGTHAGHKAWVNNVALTLYNPGTNGDPGTGTVTSPILIGCDSNSPGYQSYYNGLIGQIQVYNTVLTDAQRTSVYNTLKAKYGL